MIKIAQGAEAVLFKDKTRIIKERLSKEYRLPQLDESLRQFRTRREAKILQRLQDFQFPAPHLHDFSDKRMSIVMDFLPGQKLRDVLQEGDDYQQLAFEMGQKVGRLHQLNIIHGDLTTSNMIVDREISFIDFGLSSFSDKIEDKAVDLYLLERSLESTHYQFPDMFARVLEGYRENYVEAGKVLERLQNVQKRGRNKKKE